MVNLALIFLLATPAAAHMVLWHPSMFGFEAGNKDANLAADPLHDLSFSHWWFHGFQNEPPAAVAFLSLPAGGTLHAEIACSKHFTSWGNYTGNFKYGCDACNLTGNWVNNTHQGTGMEHSTDLYQNTTHDTLRDVRGSAIAIAYSSDIAKVQPEEFVVVSVNFRSPWYRHTDFAIPADLPACPSGGCLCLWSWYHGPDGGGDEMFAGWYRCNVTGATHTAAVPRGQVARKCPFDKNNCTIGAKVPFYWDQADGNNNWQGFQDPPFYNGDYGFMDGAQTDLFLELDPNPGYTSAWAPYPLQTGTMGLKVTKATVTGTRVVAATTRAVAATTSKAASSKVTATEVVTGKVASGGQAVGGGATPVAACACASLVLLMCL